MLKSSWSTYNPVKCTKLMASNLFYGSQLGSHEILGTENRDTGIWTRNECFIYSIGFIMI